MYYELEGEDVDRNAFLFNYFSQVYFSTVG